MSEMPEDMHRELQEALDDQLAQWGGDDRALHEANERLLDILQRAHAFDLALADGDTPSDGGGEVITPTSALQAALNEQMAARASGDAERLGRANQGLAEAYRRFNNGETPDSE
jgi:hypothetical protein